MVPVQTASWLSPHGHDRTATTDDHDQRTRPQLPIEVAVLVTLMYMAHSARWPVLLLLPAHLGCTTVQPPSCLQWKTYRHIHHADARVRPLPCAMSYPWSASACTPDGGPACAVTAAVSFIPLGRWAHRKHTSRGEASGKGTTILSYTHTHASSWIPAWPPPWHAALCRHANMPPARTFV